ncbi:MAG TPA: glycosyltransferase [Blastocatellia bacterium]|nr:glycosyltransferase [Blastocatellia bacterium]
MTHTAADRAPENRVIQGLWIGPELSLMERLSIASFLSNGHEYHLYVYDDLRNLPEGATLKDGNEILPASMIFRYEKHKSFSAFSNFFRYKLLFEKGGWWADADMVCLKPFDFGHEYVFSSEMARGREFTNCGIIKAPQGSAAMEYAWEICRAKLPEKLVWGEVGPRLMAESIKRLSLERFVERPHVFCPFGYDEWDEVLNPNKVWNLDDACAVHLWNEMWRRNERDKNQSYDPNCLYELLKRKYMLARYAGSISPTETQHYGADTATA